MQTAVLGEQHTANLFHSEMSLFPLCLGSFLHWFWKSKTCYCSEFSGRGHGKKTVVPLPIILNSCRHSILSVRWALPVCVFIIVWYLVDTHTHTFTKSMTACALLAQAGRFVGAAGNISCRDKWNAQLSPSSHCSDPDLAHPFTSRSILSACHRLEPQQVLHTYLFICFCLKAQI